MEKENSALLPKLHLRPVLWAFLISFCFSTLLHTALALKTRELFLSLRVQSFQGATLVLSSGHDGKGRETRQTFHLKPQHQESYFRLVRYAVPYRRTATVHLQFHNAGERLRIRDFTLADHSNWPYLELAGNRLKPVRDVALHASRRGALDVDITGPQPEVQLELPHWLLFRIGFWGGEWLATIFLVLPWALIVSEGWRSRFFRQEAFSELRSWWGWGALACGSVAWGLLLISFYHASHFHRHPTTPDHHWIEQEQAIPCTRVRFTRQDKVQIAGRIYEPAQNVKLAGTLLILHGNFPLGQSFPMYPLVAQALNQRGFRVMTMDFAGFGQSEDPLSLDSPHSVSLETETEAALELLHNHYPHNLGKVGLVGHSMGGDPALHVGLQNPMVQAIVLIGPPRRVWDRFHSPGDIKYFWLRLLKEGKEQYRRETMPPWYSQDHWLADVRQRDLIHMLPELQRRGHKPLLLIDGGLEMPADKKFLARFARRLNYPKSYATLEDIDHYTNVRWWRTPVTYDPPAVELLAELISSWCKKEFTSPYRWQDRFFNGLRWLFPVVWNEWEVI